MQQFVLRVVKLRVNVNTLRLLSVYRNALGRISAARKNRTYLGLHFCLILKKYEIYSQIFIKIPNIKFHVNLPVRAAVTGTGRRTDMKNIVGAFLEYANDKVIA
jgi:hypothetical protein